ncbi:MAG TPA: PAS domain-containing protein, partial [Bryobacteraceae bacterium]|nr:PAS domain-containing protein [Bryobacteraceae bacterium]
LGTAETIDATDLFRIEDKKLCFFRKRNVPTREPRLPVFPLTWNRLVGKSGLQAEHLAAPVAYGNLHQQMAERYAPPSILINSENKLVHLSEQAGRFLVHPGGEPTASALKLVRQELRIELQASLQTARERRRSVDSKPILVNFDGDARPVVVHVRPALEPERDGFVLVIFEEREAEQGQQGVDENGANVANGPRVLELESELALARQRLQAIIEETETSQEEMKASSEEMQSTNEELRSTMEELETSKEELQSINEELQTVNQQNRHKVEELGQLSSDLQNLLASTDIATLFLDKELRILRFTPKLGTLFNARVTDRGRPISDLTHRLGYPDLGIDAKAVLEQLVPVEREVQDDAGQWYLARTLPYRSIEDRIEGVVITFVDIDTRKRADDAVRAGAERLQRMISVDVVGILMLDESGTLIDCNNAFLELSGYSRQDVLDKRLTWRMMTPPEFIEKSEQQMIMLAQTGRIGPYEKQYVRQDGSRRWMIFAGASLGDGTVIEYCIDATARKQAEAAVESARRYAENIFETLHEPLLVLTSSLHVHAANRAFYEQFNVLPEESIGRVIYDLGNKQWEIPALRKLFEEILTHNSPFEDFEVEHVFESIGRRVMLLNARRLEDDGSILLGIRDITGRKRVEQELRTAEQNLRHSNDDLTHFSYALSHDMQEPLRMVVSFTQLLARDYHDKLDAKANEYMRQAVDGAMRMESLLTDLREYWSVSEQKVEALVPVDCNQVLERARTFLGSAIAESKATITHDPLPTVFLEEYPLTLLFQNLLSNAIKYRRPEALPRIHISAHRNGSAWRFSVDDQGIGMDARYLEQIFAPFKRLHGSKYAGTGLGLAMCKKIVERYHGRIWAESAAGKGTLIQFTLPAPGGKA